MYFRCVAILWLCVSVGLGGTSPRGEWLSEAFRASATFSVQSTVQLNEAARRDRALGYRLDADLTVEPASAPGPPGDGALLLRFRLESPRLMLRGSHPNAEYQRYSSIWDSHPDSTFYAEWQLGAVPTAYLDLSDPPDVLNYKKSLVSLFQFQLLDGEYNETDISGECRVAYETLAPDVFRKIKRQCWHDGVSDEEAGVSARRVTRYMLRAGGAGAAPAALHAEEVLTLGGGAEPLALKARAWHALALRSERDAPPAPAPAAARAALPPALAPLPLTMDIDGVGDDDEERLDLGEALAKHRVALAGEEAGEGGEAAAATALLHLLPALRAAAAPALGDALRDPANQDVLPGLCRALGLAGTRAAARAARDFVQPASRDALEPLAHHYLAGLALAPAAHEDVVLEALRLGATARRPAVAESALLAAAAAAARAPAPAAERARLAVRDALLKGLPKCKESRCRAVRLAALGNLGGAAVEALLGHAGGADADAAAAALWALRRAPPLAPEQLRRLDDVALNASLALEVRAAALDLVAVRRGAARSGAVPLRLAALGGALRAERGRAAHELRRVLAQRLAALAAGGAAAARALPAPRSWDARAPAGTSSVLQREPGWVAGGWRARLDSLQVAADGLLRRGAVALHAVAPDGDLSTQLEVEVWTRGLEALAGAGGAGDGAAGGAGAGDGGAAGGLALAVGGARLRDLSLFDGQAELLGHVWSGAGSAPTAVLRALRPLAERRAARPLLCGAALRARSAAALALALDAHATASLWYRTARGALELRAAVAGEARAAVRTAWGALRAAAAAGASPRLRIGVDLDFYDKVALCVRAATDDHEPRRSVELESVQGARRLRVRRGATTTLHAAGRTLALGRANDAACVTLRAADDE